MKKNFAAGTFKNSTTDLHKNTWIIFLMKYNFEWFQFLFFQKVYEFIQTCSLHFLPEFDLNLYDKIVQIAKVILSSFSLLFSFFYQHGHSTI